MPSYYASKHAVIGLVRCAAAEFARHGVRVNAVCPGVIDTPILGDHHGNPDVTAGLGAGHLAGRLGRPEEIAEVVSFLLSERASFVNGAEWKVDSGLIASPGGPGSEEGDAAAAQILSQFSGHSKAFG
jgi:NAD(P)-dependent dehydrogenase (short-subunit alcohol dehydrogenase family)